MSVRARALLDGYERDGWSGAFHADFHALLDEARDDVPALILDGLGRGLGNAEFLGEAVSYVPPETVPAIVTRALAACAGEDGRETAEDVLAHVAQQFPHLLHPHLTRLFEQGVNAEAYYRDHPWRESAEQHHAYLLRAIGAGGDDAHDALRCLLETRTPAAFAALPRNAGLLRYGTEESYLLEVGYERAPREGEPDEAPQPEALRSRWSSVRSLFARPSGPDPRGWRRLYPEASYHLRFPDGYRDRLGLPIQNRDRHPTWRLDAGDGPAQRFGGAGECACGVCGRATQRLIVLDPVPAGLGVSIPRLTLEACLRCVESNWKLVMAYVHDADGNPSPHRTQTPGDVSDVEPVAPLPAAVRLAATPARWFWQDWAVSNDRENLSRLGGYPSWVQGADYPRCPECERVMTFLLQLDAGLPGGDGSEPLCYEGVYYGFWCDGCRVSAYKWQVT